MLWGSGRICPNLTQEQGQRDHRFQPSLIEGLQPKKGRMESLKGHVDSNTGQTGISSGSGKGQKKKTRQALPQEHPCQGPEAAHRSTLNADEKTKQTSQYFSTWATFPFRSGNAAIETPERMDLGPVAGTEIVDP